MSEGFAEFSASLYVQFVRKDQESSLSFGKTSAYQVSNGTLSGKITQSGVSDNFGMLVPLYADFGKGWTKLGMATMIGNTSIDVSDIKLPTTPRRVAICALNDVLAANIQNGK